MVRLSPEEKVFIIHGIDDDIRSDGRTRMQYRPIEIETGVIPAAMGSARVTIGNTDLIVCVKADTVTPSWDKPDEGKLEFFVELSASCSPEFEGRKGEQKSEDITTVLNKTYESIPLKVFCIVPRLKCWIVNVDISVMSFEGNIFDAISFGVKAALSTAQIPNIRSVEVDEGKLDLQITDDPYNTWTPEVKDIPCVITLTKIGDNFIVDPTRVEEECSSFRSIMAVTEKGKVVSNLKHGPGSLQPSTYTKIISSVGLIGIKVNHELNSALKREKKISDRGIIGFVGKT